MPVEPDSMTSEQMQDTTPAEQQQEQAAQPEDRLAALEKQNAELTEQLKQAQEKTLRAAAEFENFKRRLKEEMAEAQDMGRHDIIKRMMPVMDNLERALAHANPDDNLARGVKMVVSQMLQAFEHAGIKRFTAEGQPFDPKLHEAVQEQESADVAPGTVLKELQSGYQYKERLLRPALVVVAKAP